MAESFFDRIHKQDTHTPDVLSCLANLSNDEVFTPPDVVNQMLDMLPKELFESTETKFLDPACKTGVFLREIAKRLLDNQAPGYKERMSSINEYIKNGTKLSSSDEEYMRFLQQVLDHIFHKQLYGIAITELTSMLSRRSLYCSKYPNGRYSVSKFDNPEGNIRFKRIQHTWVGKQCMYCGASKDQYNRDLSKETHAYEFIHLSNLEELKNMKFDVIISNPPYQLSDGGGDGSSAKPIYQLFVEQAKKLNPKYLTMIIPSRWFTGGKGLDTFRENMLDDTSIAIMHDYINSGDCFPNVSIEGGVCYFVRNQNYNGECEIHTHDSNNHEIISKRYLLEPGFDIFVRNREVLEIAKKVLENNTSSFADIVSSRNPFGLSNNDSFYDRKSTGYVKVLGRFNNTRDYKYIPKKDLNKGSEFLGKYKLFVSKADGAAGQIGNPIPARIIGKAELGDKNSVCTETFLTIGPFDTQEEAENVNSYMKTKFFRFMVAVRKNKNMTQDTYKYVPRLSYNEKWTDKKLYKKFGLSQKQIEYIEEMISDVVED